MIDDKWEAYAAAETAVETAREELEAVADNLVAIAGALRKNPARLTLDDPNFSEARRAQNEEPTKISLEELPNRAELHEMSSRFVECHKALIEAYAALPEALRYRLEQNS